MNLKEGVPGWMWPAGLTCYALIERILGGLGVERFFDLANSPNNWMPEILAVSITGFVANKAQKKYLEIKRASLPVSPEVYAERVSSSDDT